MIKKTDKEIIEACKRELTMRMASISLGIHYNTLIRNAKRLNCYQPNQGGKGTVKIYNGYKIPLHEILEGKHPQYTSSKLRPRLIKEGIKKKRCESCGIVDWNDESLSFELHHIDGISSNHILSNLQILCPNCHSQTKTFRGRNKNSKIAPMVK